MLLCSLTEASTILIVFFLDGIKKAVCNESCKHGLGRGFLICTKFTAHFFGAVGEHKKLTDFHPTSSGFDPRATQIYSIIFYLLLFFLAKIQEEKSALASGKNFSIFARLRKKCSPPGKKDNFLRNKNISIIKRNDASAFLFNFKEKILIFLFIFQAIF